MKFRCLTIAAFLLFTVNAQAQKSKGKGKNPTKTEMKTYYLVLLKKGPKRDHDSATTMKIHLGHMANIEKLAKEKKLAIAGPCTDDGDLRGIFIFTGDSVEEVSKWVDEDPAVIAGRLRYEIHPWMSMPGATLP